MPAVLLQLFPVHAELNVQLEFKPVHHPGTPVSTGADKVPKGKIPLEFVVLMESVSISANEGNHYPIHSFVIQKRLAHVGKPA